MADEEYPSLANALMRGAMGGGGAFPHPWSVPPRIAGEITREQPSQPWGWTKEYPQTAGFLANSLAALGVAGPRPGAVAPRAAPQLREYVPNLERPVSPAINVKGNVFRGQTHYDAMLASVPGAAEREAMGQDLFDAFTKHHGTDRFRDGFVTDRGRYVSREEATELLKAADNYKPSLGARFLDSIFGGGLDAMALHRHQMRNPTGPVPAPPPGGKPD